MDAFYQVEKVPTYSCFLEGFFFLSWILFCQMLFLHWLIQLCDFSFSLLIKWTILIDSKHWTFCFNFFFPVITIAGKEWESTTSSLWGESKSPDLLFGLLWHSGGRGLLITAELGVSHGGDGLVPVGLYWKSWPFTKHLWYYLTVGREKVLKSQLLPGFLWHHYEED